MPCDFHSRTHSARRITFSACVTFLIVHYIGLVKYVCLLLKELVAMNIPAIPEEKVANFLWFRYASSTFCTYDPLGFF